MNTSQKINNDFLTSYKSHDDQRVAILRLLKNVIKNTEIAKKDSLEERDVIGILKKEMKIREESEKEYRNANRADLADKGLYEINVIKSYLPEQLSESETETIVDEMIKKIGATQKSDMGRVIGAILKEHGEVIDGSTVSKITAQKLGN